MITDLLKKLSKLSTDEQKFRAEEAIANIALTVGGDLHGAIALIECAKFELMFEVNKEHTRHEDIKKSSKN